MAEKKAGKWLQVTWGWKDKEKKVKTELTPEEQKKYLGMRRFFNVSSMVTLIISCILVMWEVNNLASLTSMDSFTRHALAFTINIFLVPFILTVIYVMLRDEKNSELFTKKALAGVREKLYKIFTVLAVLLLVAYIGIIKSYILDFSWRQVFRNDVMLITVAVALFYIAHALASVKRNKFVGATYSWMQSSDYIWDKSHKFSSLLFKALAVVVFICVFIPEYALLIVVPAVVLALVLDPIYSYVIYRRHKKK
ncbi:MAG: SdpI family protein [Nanoarchaeota archaeon]|nr:SdpI family protein [Nanoarchaeota archaeon]